MVRTIEPVEHIRCDECSQVVRLASSFWHQIDYCTRPGDMPLDFCGDKCLLQWVKRTHNARRAQPEEAP